MWADDGALIERLLAVSKAIGLPLVAAGDVLMHVRSRKPMQDTLTAVRLKQPIAECGFALARNAEQHLRSRLRLARIYRPEWLQASVEIAAACTFSLDSLRLRVSRRDRAEGAAPPSATCARSPRPAARALPEGHSEAGPCASSSRRSWRSIEEQALRGLLSHRARRRALRALEGHSLPGPRLGGQLGSVLLPRHHRGEPDAIPRCCSSASSRASATRRPTSTSTSSTSGAKRSSSTSTTSTACTAPRWPPRWPPTARAARCAT